MKAVRFYMPKVTQVDNVPDPTIEHERNAIIKVTNTAICGSDLHIYNGKIPQVKNIIVGHEFKG